MLGTADAPIGPGIFPPNAAVAASNQFGISNQTDVFAVDRNGTLHVAWVVGGGAWNGPAPIGPGIFPPGAAVAASNQFGISNQTDVFAVDRNGTLHVAWVVGGGWLERTGSDWSGNFSSRRGGSSVEPIRYFKSDRCVCRRPQRHPARCLGSGWRWLERDRLPIGPGIFPPGAAVAASNQFGISNQTDVFAVDRNGTLHVAWVVGGGWLERTGSDWSGNFSSRRGGSSVEPIRYFKSDRCVCRRPQRHPARCLGSGWRWFWNGPAPIGPGIFPPGAAVAASNQFGISNQTDVFAVHRNGTLHVAWVVGGGAWNGPAPIIPPPAITLRPIQDQGRFIEVTGNRFTPSGSVKLGYDIFTGGAPNTHQTGEDTFNSDGIGGFIHRIRVNLGADVGGAQAQATDVASGRTATAEI